MQPDQVDPTLVKRSQTLSLLRGAIIAWAGVGAAELADGFAWLADDVAFVNGVGWVRCGAANERRQWTLHRHRRDGTIFCELGEFML